MAATAHAHRSEAEADAAAAARVQPHAVHGLRRTLPPFRSDARARYALDAMPLPMFVHATLLFMLVFLSASTVGQGPGLTASSRYQFAADVVLLAFGVVCGLFACAAYTVGTHMPWRRTVFVGPGGAPGRGRRARAQPFEPLADADSVGAAADADAPADADDDIPAARALVGTRHALAFWFYGTIATMVANLCVGGLSFWAVFDVQLATAARVFGGLVSVLATVDALGMMFTFATMLSCPRHTRCVRRLGARLAGRELASVRHALPPAPAPMPGDSDADAPVVPAPGPHHHLAPSAAVFHTYQRAYLHSVHAELLAHVQRRRAARAAAGAEHG